MACKVAFNVGSNAEKHGLHCGDQVVKSLASTAKREGHSKHQGLCNLLTRENVTFSPGKLRVLQGVSGLPGRHFMILCVYPTSN
eukprot:1157640-Pelagomonas_calceolata.AAC.11